jgi:spermidine synthase
MMEWMEETLYENFRFKLKVDRVLYETRTGHHHLVILENPSFGRALYLDGVLQTTERDEFIYHEMLTHPPILAHGRVRSVLIVGGGDGGMLEEALKHRTVERVTIVEIDPGVVELSKTYLRSVCGDAFEDPRLELVIADGAAFVAGCDRQSYDLIVVDSTDPIGPGEVLFTEEFYRGCKEALAPGGVLVTQNGVPFVQGEELRSSVAILRRHFADAGCYLATVPTYVGGPMAFGWASDDPRHRGIPTDVLRARFEEAGIGTRYYTPDLHHAAFALPRYVADLIA